MIVSRTMAETLLADSLNCAYTVFLPAPALSLHRTPPRPGPMPMPMPEAGVDRPPRSRFLPIIPFDLYDVGLVLCTAEVYCTEAVRNTAAARPEARLQGGAFCGWGIGRKDDTRRETVRIP